MNSQHEKQKFLDYIRQSLKESNIQIVGDIKIDNDIDGVYSAEKTGKGLKLSFSEDLLEIDDENLRIMMIQHIIGKLANVKEIKPIRITYMGYEND